MRHGSAYRFWHPTLQDYFTNLDDARLMTLVQRIEAKEQYLPPY